MSHIRLLPLVIFFAVLMLSVRLGTLWQDLTTAFASFGFSAAPAVAAGSKGTERISPETAQRNPPLPTSSLATQQLAANEPPAAPPATNAPAANDPAMSVGTKSPSQDPLSDAVSFSQTEIDVLQKLAERREQIDARERELSTREDFIKAAEGRIDARITEMKTLEASIKDLLKQYDDHEKEKLNQLIRIYGTMKPKEAAQIFDGLDMPTLLSIIENMAEAKSAPVLAAMSPEKARAVTNELTKRRQLALPPGASP